ncbi:MAG: protein-tyrosine-phosphatase [Myxococcota bacterium]
MMLGLGGCERQPEPASPSPGEEQPPDVPELPTEPTTPLHPALVAHVQAQILPAVAEVPAERRVELARLATFVSERGLAKQSADLTFICTHNSRRSQMAQVWAAAAAAWFGVDAVRSFSGGTEATAFNPRAVAALRRAGFELESGPGDNPRVRVGLGPQGPELLCHSKRFGDAPNPKEGFAAVMTCSAADKSCPTVSGAALRVGLPYEDPKVADDTPGEAARYDARSQQIAAEMFYLMSLVRG